MSFSVKQLFVKSLQLHRCSRIALFMKLGGTYLCSKKPTAVFYPTLP